MPVLSVKPGSPHPVARPVLLTLCMMEHDVIIFTNQQLYDNLMLRLAVTPFKGYAVVPSKDYF